nr:MAG TPA: Envelope small membrane protein [Caudoviricetes sp.]
MVLQPKLSFNIKVFQGWTLFLRVNIIFWLIRCIIVTK